MITICGAYLQYLDKIEMTSRNASKKSKIRNVFKFIPELDLAKKRINIPILIVQILSHCRKSEHNKLGNAVFELSKYGKKNFNINNPDFRTFCFIQLISCVVAQNFHLAAIERKSAPLLERLASSPIKISEQNQILEPIPYEHLWELILEDLESLHKSKIKRKKAI